MCVSQFSDYCDCSQYYHFSSIDNFYDKIDYDKRNLKNIELKKLEYNKAKMPTEFCSYGTDIQKIKKLARAGNTYAINHLKSIS